uniref:(northern house mosquito) hypothetical protein n=1 Tax=Culex pipiens TaxID=7175 RepID=A0A8D8KZ87_CULPI
MPCGPEFWKCPLLKHFKCSYFKRQSHRHCRLDNRVVLWYLLLTGYERSRSLNMVLIDPCFYKTSFCQKVFLVYHTHEFPQNLGLAMLHYLLEFMKIRALCSRGGRKIL